MHRRFGARIAQSGRSVPRLARWLAAATVTAIILTATLSVPRAGASPSHPLPAAAQGHPYRHGAVPPRGQTAQGAGASSRAPSGNLSFGGGVGGIGVTTGSPSVYLVFWGSQWGSQATDSNGDVTLSGDPDGMAPYLQEFIKGLGTDGETWSGVMTEYCQGIAAGSQTCPSSNTQHVGYPTGGVLAGVWVDESSAAPQQATGNQIGAEAVSAASHFGNTSSAANRNAQYVVVSPTGTEPDGFNTSSGPFCAWHDYTADPTLSGGVTSSSDGPLAFTNLPYLTDAGAGCGEDFVNSGSAGLLDGVSIVEGHEYAETITDQFPPGGWTDNAGNENADKCAWISPPQQGYSRNITLATGSFAVQSTWANDLPGCEVSHSIVTDPNIVTVNTPGSQAGPTGAAIAPLQVTAQDSEAGQTFTWSATGLPTGLSIDSSTGVISGTPTGTGTSTVTVTATDSTMAAGSTTFAWTITRRSTSTGVSCSPGSLDVGTATTCTATVSDDDTGTASTPGGTVTFSVSPTGMGSFTSTTCTLSPTGTAGVAGCSTSYTPSVPGAQTITAAYGADATHASSSSTSGFGLTVTTGSTGINPTPVLPQDRTAPVIDGVAGAGDLISCSPGDWTAGPTSYAYQWNRDGSPLAGATSQGYTVRGADQGATLTCTVTASNVWGAGRPATSSGLRVPEPGSPHCPAAAGRLHGATLGAARLGMTRPRIRAAYTRSRRQSSRYQDNFCLTGSGVRVGYTSPKLLVSVARRIRKALAGRAVWITSANPTYSSHGIRPGTVLARARPVLAAARRFKVGRVRWYLLPGTQATAIFRVQGGAVREVGIADDRLTGTAHAELVLARALA